MGIPSRGAVALPWVTEITPRQPPSPHLAVKFRRSLEAPVRPPRGPGAGVLAPRDAMAAGGRPRGARGGVAMPPGGAPGRRPAAGTRFREGGQPQDSSADFAPRMHGSVVLRAE